MENEEYEPKEETTRQTLDRQDQRLVPGQSSLVGEIFSDGGSAINQQVGHPGGIFGQLFGGKITSIDQAIIIEMIDQCRDQLEESRACVIWYQEQEAKVLKRLSNLEQVLERLWPLKQSEE